MTRKIFIYLIGSEFASHLNNLDGKELAMFEGVVMSDKSLA